GSRTQGQCCGCRFCTYRSVYRGLRTFQCATVNMDKHCSVICALTLILFICVNLNSGQASKPKDKLIVKAGMCPRRTWGMGVCAEYCTSDSECEGDMKCCSNGCGHECMKPYKVKRGRCPLPQPTQMCAGVLSP
ncbi:hypothetical protein NQD34_005583, partial [Periophthalmus magnuspinnatus]